MAKTEVNFDLLKQIDKLELGPRIKEWKTAEKNAPWHLYTDREKYAVESWNQTEGEDIELRRAKLFAHVAENVGIKIYDFDVIVGRPTVGVIGCHSCLDISGDSMPGIWSNSDDEIKLTMDAKSGLGPDDKKILQESARTFGPTCAPKMTYQAWEAVLGSWPKDVEDAKLRDPGLQACIYGNVTSVFMWDKLINKGLSFYIKEAQQHIDEYIANKGTDVDKLYFWQSSIITCKACIDYSHRYAALARKMAKAEAKADRKAELLRIADCCDWVPEHPARTFREALQSMAIANACKCLEHPGQFNSHWGEGDRYLYPLFIKDINEGVITIAQAAEYLEEVIGRWGTQTFVAAAAQQETHQINYGINNFVIGGVDKNGDDVSNELSYLFLHATALLKQSSPTAGVKWNSKTPDWLMEKAIETNVSTRGGIPLFENSDVIVKHYVESGIPKEEACDWAGLGCVYPCIPGRSEHYGAEAVAGFNLAGMLHMALHNGRAITGKTLGVETGDPRQFKSTEEIYNAFLAQEKYVLYRIFWLCSVAREEEYKYIRMPFNSVMGLQYCTDIGEDTLVPDPEHTMWGISDRAIIDVADSLVAIDHLVFKDHKLTLSELMDALDSNFAGERGEEIRQMCLAQPKFGNDIDEVDEMAKKISAASAKLIKDYDDSPYRGYMIAREGLSWHYYGGLGVGALPNGRKALEPLNDGSISPMRGADKKGPTAVLRSVLKAGFEDSYAQVLNQKFTSTVAASPASKEKLTKYTTTFLKNGGTHIQYNLVDRQELLDAKAHPEEHRDLIVRVGGFSAYFTQLSSAIQDDVILRSENVL